jgi:hypothetical protein
MKKKIMLRSIPSWFLKNKRQKAQKHESEGEQEHLWGG